jgi:plastocyanin
MSARLRLWPRCLATLMLSLALAGPGAAVVGAQAPACQFVLGFATLRALIGPQVVGDCLEDQRFAANGDAQQQTTRGLMAWRKADNWTAFTDGYRTWINGPFGLVQRLNTDRFSWEGDVADVAEARQVLPGAASPTVRMEDDLFTPVDLVVPVGTTVTWVNGGMDEHTVVAKDLTFDSGVIAPGQVFQRRFEAAGEYAYICDLHDGMVGSILVQ